MITECPACNRQFRIYAGQLSAAKGLVQCGYCGEQFNALDRLYDHPAAKPAPPMPAPDLQEEPRFEIPGHGPEASLQPPDAGPAVESDGGEAEIHADDPPPIAEGTEAADGDRQDEADELAKVLFEEETSRASPWGRMWWMAGILLLLLAIGMQILWFNRDEVLARYPRLVPLAREICDRVSCDLVRVQDISSIKLLNRDVRDHPRFENSLLVNATIENQAANVQPFPDIQLVLFDPNGKVSGYRRFTPREYLDQDVNREAGMAPGAPIHLVLEVTGAGESAVSFEFRFL